MEKGLSQGLFNFLVALCDVDVSVSSAASCIVFTAFLDLEEEGR